jgi:energy-coupling factor transporter transmembrane protein EcfT
MTFFCDSRFKKIIVIVSFFCEFFSRYFVLFLFYLLFFLCCCFYLFLFFFVSFLTSFCLFCLWIFLTEKPSLYFLGFQYENVTCTNEYLEIKCLARLVWLLFWWHESHSYDHLACYNFSYETVSIQRKKCCLYNYGKSNNKNAKSVCFFFSLRI